MQPRGMGEAEQADLTIDGAVLVGQVRRIAGIGPAYEVVRLVGQSKATIRVFESGEEVTLKIEDILKDPATETIP